jgi:predicted MFS family arabinose efflux permease
VQSRAHDAVRSRVFAAQEGAAHVAFTAAMVAGGVLVEATGPRGAVATAAACGLVAAFVALGMRRHAGGDR